MSFGEILTQLRKERGFKNRKAFADYIGIPSTTLRNYETNVREPGHIFLTQMANLFNVSTDYLLGLTSERTPLVSENDLNIKKYHQLNTDGKEKVGEYIDDLLKIPAYQKDFTAKPKIEIKIAARPKEGVQQPESIMSDEDLPEIKTVDPHFLDD